MTFLSGMFGGRPDAGNAAANAAPVTPPAPQVQSAPAPQQANAQNLPLNAALPAAPAAAALSPSVGDIIGRLTQAGRNTDPVNPTDPTQFAQDFIASMMTAPNQQAEPSAPRINPAALREAFGAVDFTTGLDMSALTEALQGRGGAEVDVANLTQQAFQAQGLNVVTAMAPLINQMVQSAMEQAVTQSTSRTHHGLTSQSLVTEFVAMHPYANNPLMMNMVREFCNTIVAQNPHQIDRKQVFQAIDLAFQGMSQTIRPAEHEGQQNLPRGAQTGFGEIFG